MSDCYLVATPEPVVTEHGEVKRALNAAYGTNVPHVEGLTCDEPRAAKVRTTTHSHDWRLDYKIITQPPKGQTP